MIRTFIKHATTNERKNEDQVSRIASIIMNGTAHFERKISATQHRIFRRIAENDDWLLLVFYASHHPFSILINQSHHITSWAIHRFQLIYFSLCAGSSSSSNLLRACRAMGTNFQWRNWPKGLAALDASKQTAISWLSIMHHLFWIVNLGSTYLHANALYGCDACAQCTCSYALWFL